MMTTIVMRSTGWLLILAGILFSGFMFFHPANNPQGALETVWVPVHLTWLLAYLCTIVGFVPLYPVLLAQGMASTIAYWVSFLGLVLSLPIASWDAFLVPYLAHHSPEMILQIEETSLELPVLVFRVIVFLTVLIFSGGFFGLGLTLLRNGLMSFISGIGLALGAPLFWIGALFFSQGSVGNGITEAGAVLFGVGLVGMGVISLKPRLGGTIATI